jgi:hypothetical protein
MTNWVWGGPYTGVAVPGTATFQILRGWTSNYFANADILAGSTLQAEIQAATQVAAVQRAVTFTGNELNVTQLHVENEGTCTTFVDNSTVFNGGHGVTFSTVRFNYDVGLDGGSGEAYLCQQSFPFVSFGEGAGNILWSNSTLQQDQRNPIIIDFEDASRIFKMALNQGGNGQNFVNPNLRVSGFRNGWGATNGAHFGGYWSQTQGMGAGVWDASPFYGASWNLGSYARTFIDGARFSGYRPDPGTTPRMYAALYNSLQPSTATVTMPLASPGIVNWTANGLAGNAPLTCSSSGGSLPPALTAGTIYFAQSVATNTIQLSLHPNGASLNFTAAGTGTITCTAPVRSQLGTYPGINGMTNYSVADWNIPVGTGGGLPFNAARFVASAHYFDSYGVNLTTSQIPTLGWTYQGGSFVLLLDQGTLQWVYPGLGITLDNGSGARQYIITGVWPQLFLDTKTATVTFTIGTNTVNWTANGLQNGMTVTFSGGTLPTGVNPNTNYYVTNQATNSFQLTDINGTAITMSGSSSGTITGTSYHPGYATILNASHGEQCHFQTCLGEGTVGTIYTGNVIGQNAYSWSNH